jgi:hypothetical protein
MIPSWSYSRLGDFELCKFRAWLKHDQRIPEPQRPLAPGKTELANDRGARIHENLEQYVRGDTDELCPEAETYFGPQIDLLRVLYAEGMVSVEGEWGMNQDWEPCDWKTAWLRLKLDALCFHSKTEATVIDYKTGRLFGNEAKHAEQLQLYALCTALRYPDLERIRSEAWYIDQPDPANLSSNIRGMTFLRAQALRFRTGFNKRGTSLTSCVDFPANPNKFSCKWCMYGPWGGAQCQQGVR